MIPKKIHYCWLGGKPLPPLAEKCIASWKKHCPDYEIIQWNESNYDFKKQTYMREAFEEKKWGFVPDYARLDIIWQHGGIYLDTDVEIIKSFDPLLLHKCFFGLESDMIVALGLGFGAEAGHPILKEMMDDYENYHFKNSDGSLNLLPSPQIQTPVFQKHGLQSNHNQIQTLDQGIHIYPPNYFAPKNEAGLPQTLPESYSVHHYMGSWRPMSIRLKTGIYKQLCILSPCLAMKIVSMKQFIVSHLIKTK